jgi:hypothetical protein
MTVDYKAMQNELPKLRAALTRAKNSGDPHKVIAVVDKAARRFDEIGWPDQWPTWTIAKSDAEQKLRMGR